jgi:protein-L-isoaspartate(D-aspartate) O-methyltransferase
MSHWEAAAAHRELMAGLWAQGIRNRRVLGAMERVPRHLFVPEPLRAYAYEDRPLPIGCGQTISQPLIVARMLEALALEGRERVLEVGTGSGYQTALLALLARDVDSIEIAPDLAVSTRRLLFEHRFHNVRVILGDGSQGCSEGAPYDAIVVAAAAPFVPDALFNQLSPFGHLVVPVGDPTHQRLRLIIKHDRAADVRDLGGCVFVPLRSYPTHEPLDDGVDDAQVIA